jgi:hypothetical protein
MVRIPVCTLWEFVLLRWLCRMEVNGALLSTNCKLGQGL